MAPGLAVQADRIKRQHPIKALRMPTSSTFAFPTIEPTFVVFRPWSHTDRRQMLAVLEGPFASLDEAMDALPRHAGYALAQVATLFPLGVITRPEQDPSEADETAVDPKSVPSVYIAVSWTARSPGKLRSASRPFKDGVDADNWADFCADLPENAGRRFGVLRAEGPIPAAFSP